MSKSVVFLVIFVAAGLICGSAGAVNVIGEKFYDYNKDGAAGSNSFPLEGWTIYLTWLNGTNVTGKQAVTGPDGTYNISGIDPFFDYNVCEVLKPGWENTSPRCEKVGFVTCGGGPLGANEFETNSSLLGSFMPIVPTPDSYALLGYNARIGNAVSGTGQDEEFKLFATSGTWNQGQSSDGLSDGSDYTWANHTYVPFNATWIPGATLYQNATWTVAGVTENQNRIEARPNSVPIRDILLRLHAEKNTGYRVELNNLTLKQGSITYILDNSYLTFNHIDANNQDLYLLVRASNILIDEGGSDIGSGGFSLTGDIRFTWPAGSVPKGNDIKSDIYVGRYNCNYLNLQPVYFGNHINGSISGYKLDANQNPLEGWNITAYNETRLELYYDVTDVNGYYNISDVNLSYYWLNETPQEGFTQVTPNRTVQINVTTLHLFDQNFTNLAPGGNISGYKIYDYNGNGRWDPGESGLPLWNITLVNTSDLSVVDWNLTDITGYYSFTNVSFGTYYLNETLQYGWQSTNGTSKTIEVNSTYREFTNLNFTNKLVLGNITGIKFEDKECDGDYDPPINESDPDADTLLPGWNITLYNATTGAFIANTTTDENGQFNFTGIDATATGGYNVTEELKPGWKNCTPTSVIVTFDSAVCPGIFHIFSDALLTARLPDTSIAFVPESRSGCTTTYELDIHTFNPGFTVVAQSGQNEFEWENGGMYDFNVTYTGRSGTDTVTYTITNGTFTKTLTWAGTYDRPISDFMVRTRSATANSQMDVWNLTFTPAGGPTLAIPDSGTPGDTNTSWANFSAGRPLDILWIRAGALTGIPDLDENGFALTGTQRMNWTGSKPTQSNLAYTIKFGKPFCPLDGSRYVIFGNQQRTFCIEGYKIDNCTKEGLAGWNITATNATVISPFGEVWNTTTNDTGYFQFCNLKSGVYTVCEDLEDGWINVTPICQTVPISDDNVTGIYFNNTRLLCIEGYKIDNTTGNGLPGWNITVSNQTAEIATVVTNATGWYQFCGLPPGVYQICEELKDGFTNVSSLCQNVTLTCSNATNVNFTNEAEKTYCINGTKTNCSDQSNDGCPLDGWKMTVYNETSDLEVGNDTTDINGYYEICGLVPGDYWICEEERPGFTNLTDACSNFTIAEGNVTFDIRNAELTCIDGYKINNATGLGLAGWNITVSNQTAEIATVITNDTGYYKVCNLTPGYNYTVCEELKDGWTSVGPTCIDVDDLACFGAYVQFNNDPPPLYCIEGRKVDAHTGNGLAGWNITVTGEGVVLSNLTNATGYYEFCDLPDGDYTVCEELQPGWLNVSPLCYDISVDGGNVVVDDFVNDPVGNVSGYKINQGTGMGLPGWTIRLVNDTSGITYATNVTLSDGSFQFLNVPFGPYRLEEIPQAGWTQVTPNTTFTIDMENREVTYDFYNAEAVSYCCECPPNAKFTYTNNGLTVDFQDTSSGPQTAKWYWVFGDGSISSEQNPSHTYSNSGTYIVRLYIRWYDCNGVMSSYWKYYYTKVTV